MKVSAVIASSRNELENVVMSNDAVTNRIKGKKVKKVIVVPNKLVNVVVV